MSKNRMRGFVILNKPGHGDIGDNISLNLADDDRGLLLNRMTETQRDAIPDPPEGLLIYNLTAHTVELWNGNAWYDQTSETLLDVLTTLNVGSTASIGTDLTVGGLTAIGTSLSVGTDASISGNTVIDGNLSIGGDLAVTGNTTFARAPTAPTPSTGTDLANKSYVDDQFPIDLSTVTGTIPLSQTTGNLPANRLNSGTNASINTFWRGNGTWAKISLTTDVSGNLPLTEVSGNLTVSHLDSGTNASTTTFWRGDGTWTPVNLSTSVTGNLPLSQVSGTLAIGNGGTGANSAATAFANIAVAGSSINSNGFLKLNNDLILQWGIATLLTGQTSVAVSFPTTFASSVFTVQVTGRKAGGEAISYGAANSVTTTGFEATASTTAAEDRFIYFFAVGT